MYELIYELTKLSFSTPGESYTLQYKNTNCSESFLKSTQFLISFDVNFLR